MSAPGGPDPRLNAVREDLADARLKGRVNVPRFASPVARRVGIPAVGLRRRPATDAPLDTELLYGEPVHLFDGDGEWSWVQSTIDGYVGYVPHAALEPIRAGRSGEPAHEAPPSDEPSHRVSVPLALVFRDASIKSPVRMKLPMGARLVVEAEEAAGSERFHRICAGYVLDQHVAGVHAPEGDWVRVAETFVGAPYLFGGKTWDGIDCSALVQLAIQSAGGQAPRDSDMQEARLGTPAERTPGACLRGDLVFWKGHVGIMLDDTRLLHANGFHMTTAVEPLAHTRERLGAKGLQVTAVRHVPPGPGS